MDTILYPIMWVIAWIMYGIHEGLVALGMDSGAGPAWVFAILGLTVVVRLCILPLYNKQIKASRNMQALQPEMMKIQRKYKGKRDQISMQRQQEELQALYKKHDASPFASCLPLIIQMPVLFALYRVLIAFPSLATGSWNRDTLGPITKQIAQHFENSTVFGAPLSASFTSAPHLPGYSATTIRVVAGVLVLIMIFTMYWTQRQLMKKNMPEIDPSEGKNPAQQMQKAMLYGFPLLYLFSGVAFPIGVLVYWCAGNLWNMGQQSWFIRNNPTPGSKAYKEREARLAAKRKRAGLTEEEAQELDEREAQGGQRYQPMGKERAKKAGIEQPVAEPANDEPVRGKDGLTDEERARKRYERRQAERARRKQNKNKKNRKHN